MASFPALDIHTNPTGWGPTAENIPSQFADLPFAPYSKGDLGKSSRAADFSANPNYQRYNKFRGRDEAVTNKELQYKHDTAEDSSFSLVDTTKTANPHKRQQRRTWGNRGGRGGRGGRWGDRNSAAAKRGEPPAEMGGGRGRGRGNQAGGRGRNDRRNDHRRRQQQRIDRQASVKVMPDWDLLEEFDLAQLTKLQTNRPETEDLRWCGFVDQYDETYDHVSTRNPKPLERFENRMFYHVTTTDDPVLEELVESAEGNVYATDVILAHLMASPRSVYPWDIVVQKIDGTLFFDKRDDSKFDYLTVSETATEAPNSEDLQDMNHPDQLGLEASAVNQNFTQQILRKDPKSRETFDSPNPFYEEQESMQPASVAYRYRRFTLGSLRLVVRCELHGSVKKRGEKQYMTAFALNEWDSSKSGGVEWRQKIDNQRGAVFATELKNNSCKLAKWTAQSVIAGAGQMKVGFVSRNTKKDRHHHTILATQFYKPTEFAQQIALNVQNMWGIIKTLADKFLALDDGKFVIMKDPNKPIARIFRVPPETFEEDDSEDEDDESGAAEQA